MSSVLLYSGVRDGWKGLNFHYKCDGKGPTIVLFKSDKGKRFGGFTSISWHSEERYSNDPNAFLFSLNIKAQFIVK